MDIRSYLLENNFKITMSKNYIDIINYNSIENVNSNNIILKLEQGKLAINGNNLVIKKLLNDEIVIIGSINSVEFR